MKTEMYNKNEKKKKQCVKRIYNKKCNINIKHKNCDFCNVSATVGLQFIRYI